MNRRAFSLVELLVVMGLIGVLVSLVLPGLAGARVSARQTQGLSNQRQVAISFTQYADEARAYPFTQKGAGIPGAPIPPNPDVIMVRWWPDTSIVASSDHFNQSWMWPGLVSRFAPWPENYRVWLSPGLRKELSDLEAGAGDFDDIQNTISLRYSNAFVARPELFRADAPANEALLRATGPHEVAFPANKVLLWDAHLAFLNKAPPVERGHFRAPTPMAFADQHAALHDPTTAAAPAENPLKLYESMTLHDTPDGILGRDF